MSGTRTQKLDNTFMSDSNLIKTIEREEVISKLPII